MPNNNSGGVWSGAAAAGLGMLGGIGQGNRQYHRQKRLMNFQQANQMALNRQGHDLQMDLWNKTNYGAQVAHMKDAGLNPALMYGSAGQGGSTGSQGGGSASGGSAAGERVMDLNNMLTGAQIRDLEASAKKKKAEADKITGVDTREAEARTAGINENIKKTIQDVENLSQAKKNLVAEEALKVTQREREEIRRDIERQNRKFLENNDLSEQDFGIIKGLKRVGFDVYRAIQFMIYSTPEEAGKIVKFKKEFRD